MTHNRIFERINRTVNDPQRFNGGHVGHGRLLPMQEERKFRWWGK